MHDLIKQLFFDNEIPFEFIESPDIFESNVLFLTDNKNNLSSTLANVFLMKQEYDFLDVKNAIFIRSVEDIVRVFKNDVWKKIGYVICGSIGLSLSWYVFYSLLYKV